MSYGIATAQYYNKTAVIKTRNSGGYLGNTEFLYGKQNISYSILSSLV
jgi:hypothetical protein